MQNSKVNDYFKVGHKSLGKTFLTTVILLKTELRMNSLVA